MPILYSTHCPKCRILEKKMNDKNIEYQECNDVETMLKLGLSTVPWLQVENKLLDFNEANQWINQQ